MWLSNKIVIISKWTNLKRWIDSPREEINFHQLFLQITSEVRLPSSEGTIFISKLNPDNMIRISARNHKSFQHIWYSLRLWIIIPSTRHFQIMSNEATLNKNKQTSEKKNLCPLEVRQKKAWILHSSFHLWRCSKMIKGETKFKKIRNKRNFLI